MTTENTEIINSVPAEALNNAERAETVVKELSANDMVQEIKRLLDELDFHKVESAKNRNRATENQSKYLNLYNSIAEFIKDHVTDDDISTDDLKELAEELNISLTKTIKVKFTVACEYEFEVPLDFEDNDIDESDFSINISSSISNDDVEETHESIDVTDFEVEEA